MKNQVSQKPIPLDLDQLKKTSFSREEVLELIKNDRERSLRMISSFESKAAQNFSLLMKYKDPAAARGYRQERDLCRSISSALQKQFLIINNTPR